MSMNCARHARRWGIAASFWMLLATGVRAEPVEESVDLIVRSEVTIQQSAAVVWQRLLDFSSWKSVRSLQRVSGEADQEGDLRLLTPCGATESASYFVRVVKLIPRERLVLKLTAKDGKAFLGFVAFDLRETQGSVKIVYDTYIQYRVPTDAPDRPSIARRLQETMKSKVDEEHLVLKAWAEGKTQREPGQCS